MPASVETRRAGDLRRRVAWYCILALALLGLSWVGVVKDWQEVGADEEARKEAAASVVYDALLTGMYAAALGYVLRVKPDRRRLLSAVTVLTVAASAVCAVFEGWGLFTPREDRTTLTLALYGIGPFVLLHGLASLLVPMRVSENLRIVMPCAIVYGVGALALLPLPASSRLILACGYFVACAPAVIWSAWRFGETDARYRASAVQSRFGELTAELAYARRVHESLFPPPISTGRVRVAYRYEPMREIGGDFLFVHPLAFPPSATDDAVSIVLIDVSGHGVPAALAVNRLHGELQRLFAQDRKSRPAKVMAALNSYACVALSPAGVYATGICLRIDGRSGTVEWASAGHPTAMIRTAQNEVIELESTAPMLGVLEEAEYQAEQRETLLSRGSVLVAFTDGVTEARGEGREELGTARVRDTVRLAQGGLGAVAKAVNDLVMTHRSGEATDDVLVVEARLADETEGADALTLSWTGVKRG
jgi:hypothetical protein